MPLFKFPTAQNIKVATTQTLLFTGFNPDIDSSSTPEDIWPIGGLIAFASVQALVSVVSASANDAAAGSGARTVILFGLDDTFAEISEVVTLNGLTPINTVANFLHVQTATVITTGATGSNEGIITFTISGGIVNGIAIGKNQTQSCARIIPASSVSGTEAHLLNVFAMAGKQLSVLATVALIITPKTGAVLEALDIPITADGGPFVLDFIVPVTFAAGTKLVARVTDVSANDVLVSAGLQFCWLNS